jgi:hypothetical protein
VTKTQASLRSGETNERDKQEEQTKIDLSIESKQD